MPELDQDPEQQIEEQLKAMQEEREALQEDFDSGNISEREYKKAMSNLNFREAQLRERNQQTIDRTQQTLTRDHDTFSD